MKEEKKQNAWLKFDKDGRSEIFDFCEGYKEYMSLCKTERESVLEAQRMAEEKGYGIVSVKAGDKELVNEKAEANDKYRTSGIVIEKAWLESLDTNEIVINLL